MTTAERIARMFNDDGQCFDPANGLHISCVTIEDVCGWECRVKIDHKGSYASRYTFEDESVLIVTEGGWDLGHLDCWCWQGAGHSDECRGIS